MEKTNIGNNMDKDNGKTSSWEKLLKDGIKWSAMLTLLVPFANVLSLFYFNIFTKSMLYHILIGAMLSLYLVLVFMNPDYLPRFSRKDKDGRRRLDWIFLSVTAFVALTFISNLFSINPYNSFWGSVNFTAGSSTLLEFYVFFVVLFSVFKERGFWDYFLQLNVILGGAMALVAILQTLRTGQPALATFGNSSHLSGYLVFIIFQSAVMYFWGKERSWKKIYLAVSIIAAISLFFSTGIQGSMVGAVAGLLAVLIIYHLAHPEKKRRLVAWSAFLFLAAITVGLVGFLVQSGKLVEWGNGSLSIKNRFIAWNAGINGFQERPFTGYGSENFWILFDKYYDPAYANQGTGLETTETGFDLPHNKFVEVASANGIFTLLAYLSIFLLAINLAYRKYRETREGHYLFLGGLLIAYPAHLFFLFDTVVTYALFFSSLAFLSFLAWNPQDEAPYCRKPARQAELAVFSGAVAVLYLLFLFFLVVRPVQASLVASRFIGASQRGEYGKAEELLRELESFDLYYIQKKAVLQAAMPARDNLFEKEGLTDEQFSFFKRLVPAMELNVEMSPGNDYYAIRLAQAYDIAGKRDRIYLEKSRDLLEKIIAGGTKRVDAYAILVRDYGFFGEKEKMAEIARKGIALDPTYAFAYALIARSFYDSSDYKTASQYYKQAIENGYKALAGYKGLADSYVKLDYRPDAITAYEQLVRMSPRSPQLWSNLATLYMQNGQIVEARQTAEDMKERFPNLSAQVEDFLSKLPK